MRDGGREVDLFEVWLNWECKTVCFYSAKHWSVTVWIMEHITTKLERGVLFCHLMCCDVL